MTVSQAPCMTEGCPDVDVCAGLGCLHLRDQPRLIACHPEWEWAVDHAVWIAQNEHWKPRITRGSYGRWNIWRVAS